MVDFDLIPAGTPGKPTIKQVPTVSSVNGQTGAVKLPAFKVIQDLDGFYTLRYWVEE